MSIKVVSAASVIADLEAGNLASTVITHDGPRHADEVLALARLAAGTPRDLRVCFTRDQKVLGLRNTPSLTFVDVGGSYAPGEGRFDHHFRPTPAREDGLPLSSFGMVTLADHPDEVDHPLVRHVDAIDNGVKGEPAPGWWPCFNSADPNGGSVAWAVHHANPANVDGSPVTDAQFEARAVELIELFMPLFGWDGALLGDDDCERAVLANIAGQLSVWHADNHAAYQASAKRVAAALEGHSDPVLVLNQYEGAALDTLAAQPETGPLYVVFPGPGGRQWMVQQVATAPGSFAGRKPLPEAWAGLRDAAIQEATGVADAVFCHPGRFICGAVNREGAITLARLAVGA